MIEEIVREQLTDVIGLPAYLEEPAKPPKNPPRVESISSG